MDDMDDEDIDLEDEVSQQMQEIDFDENNNVIHKMMAGGSTRNG